LSLHMRRSDRILTALTFHPCQVLPLYSFDDQKQQCNENPQASETGQLTTLS